MYTPCNAAVWQTYSDSTKLDILAALFEGIHVGRFVLCQMLNTTILKPISSALSADDGLYADAARNYYFKLPLLSISAQIDKFYLNPKNALIPLNYAFIYSSAVLNHANPQGMEIVLLDMQRLNPPPKIN